MHNGRSAGAGSPSHSGGTARTPARAGQRPCRFADPI